MYQFNEQFAAASRQFADTAAQINRIALENAEAIFGLQLNALNDRANATFAFFGEAAQARDLDALKTLFPKGVQVARENVERAVTVGQDVFGRTLKANEAIGQIAKTQIETVAAKTQATVEEAAAKAASAAQAPKAK